MSESEQEGSLRKVSSVWLILGAAAIGVGAHFLRA
jgi:hypothetical protein